MATAPFLFDEESAARIIGAVRQVEGAPQNARPRRGSDPGGATAGVYFARVTSSTADGSGYYPAVITRLNTADGSYTDFGPGQVTGANGEPLSSGVRYGVKPVGSHSGQLAYQTLSADKMAFVREIPSVADACGYFRGYLRVRVTDPVTGCISYVDGPLVAYFNHNP